MVASLTTTSLHLYTTTAATTPPATPQLNNNNSNLHQILTMFNQSTIHNLHTIDQ
jgi:hypothetical protein